MFMRFFQLLKPHSHLGMLLGFILICSSMLIVVMPFFYKELVDIGILQQNIQVIIWMVVCICVAMILQELFFLGQTAVALHIRKNVFSEIKKTLYAHVMNLPQSYFANQHKGKLLSRLTSDVGAVQHLLLDRLVFLVRNLLVGFAIMGILLVIQWRLVVAALIFLPLFYLFYMMFRREISSASRKLQEKKEALMERWQEDLGMVKAIQSFSVLAQRTSHTLGFMTAVESARNKLDYKYAVASASTVVIKLAGIMIIWGLGGYEVMQERMTIGTLIAISFFLNYMINLFYSAYYTVMEFHGAMPAAKRIFELLDIPPVTDDVQAIEADFTGKELVMDHVHYAYDQSAMLLKGVDLQLQCGEMVALTGESGQGKTTLANMLQRFIDPDQGEILLGGTPIRKIKLSCLRKTIAMIPQEDLLFDQTIRENIRLGRENVSEDQFMSVCKQSGVDDFVQLLEEKYETVIGERGAKLSGGQKKRIAIARALLEEPYILILDEATSMLDEASEATILESIKELKQNKIVFLITHKRSNLSYADRVLQLKDGKLFEITT